MACTPKRGRRTQPQRLIVGQIVVGFLRNPRIAACRARTPAASVDFLAKPLSRCFALASIVIASQDDGVGLSSPPAAPYSKMRPPRNSPAFPKDSPVFKFRLPAVPLLPLLPLFSP